MLIVCVCVSLNDWCRDTRNKLTKIQNSVCLKSNCRWIADDILNEREKNKLLQEEMEATLHDIQNM